MSAQTGTAPASGPVSQRAIDRAKFRVERLRSEPNPVWVRELKQAARLGRTPIFLAALTILLTLLVASVGGLVSTSYSPATTGVVLFHVFFSFGWFVVTLAGPAVAANSIASEREGHTWEAVLLTGLPPATVARGKFLASFTGIGSYIVALAPVGALSFLFGGVTATQIIVAFAFLFLIALLSVAFGLALSSKMDRLRAAILATLLLAFPASIFSYLTFGFGFGALAHKVWPSVAEFGPVWLPAAYDRVEVSGLYILCLFVLPVVAVTLPAWFLYEVTIANLTSATDDRSSGLKRWFLVAAPVLTILACVGPFLAPPTERVSLTAFGGSITGLFFLFAAFLFQGEPIGPSRRVIVHWDRAGASKLRRYLGPGVLRTSSLLLGVGLASVLATVGAGVLSLSPHPGMSRADEMASLGVFAVYAACFWMFIVGLAAALRARSSTSTMARVVMVAILFALSLGPWIGAAIAGIIVDNAGPNALSVAAPSPFFVFYLMGQVDKHDGSIAIPTGIASAIALAGIGLILFGAAQRRTASIIRKHEAVLAETDRLLAAEDDAMAARAEAEAAEASGLGDPSLEQGAVGELGQGAPPPEGEPVT